MTARANLAVVARRSEPVDSLDYFPTPPWATRAFMSELTVRGLYIRGENLLDPCCGEGHMAAVLREFADETYASDIFPYGYGDVADFLDDGEKSAADWIVMNPPFNTALQFVDRALHHPAARAAIGVAALVRLAWLEGGERSGRYDFFQAHPPTLVLICSGRVPMVKGRWDPKARTATAYAWAVWIQPDSLRSRQLLAGPTLGWIRPDAQAVYGRTDDAVRFGAKTPAPLLDGGAA